MKESTNTLSVWQYVFRFILWGRIVPFIYQKTVFIGFDGWSYSASSYLMVALLAVSALIGIFTTLDNRRNNFSVFISLAIPFELYTILTYFNIFPKSILSIIIITAALVLIYCALILARKITNRRRGPAILKRRIKAAVLGTCSIVSVCWLTLALPIGINNIKGNELSTVGAYSEDNSINHNIETICKLQESQWETFNSTEKLSLLQTMADIETNILGVKKLRVVTSSELSDITLGQYDGNKNLIIISEDYLKNGTAHDLLKTLCHECRHCWQHSMVEAYNQVDENSQKLMMFRNVEKFKREFADYANADEDAILYQQQYCEEDARYYSMASVQAYFLLIEDQMAKKADQQ